MRYSPQFVNNLTEKLFVYALGRSVDHRDMPQIRAIVRSASGTNYRMSSLILGIVKSPAFTMNLHDADGESATAAATARNPRRRKRIGSDHVSDEEASSETHLPPRRGRDAGAAVPRLDGAGAERAGAVARRSEDAAGDDFRAARLVADLLGGPRSERPATPGRNVGLGFIHQPLAPWQDKLTIVSGLDATSSMPPPGSSGGDHSRASATFTGTNPKKTAGADIYGGVSIDQIVARKYGQDTLLPSIQLAIEDPGANTGICGWGYSCAYSNSVSWAAPNKPLPHEINPQLVFERLYGDGSTPEERQARRAASDSILDAVTEKIARLRSRLPASDRSPPERLPRVGPRDGAPAADRGARSQVSRRRWRCRSACPSRSTSTSSCTSICRRSRSRATSRACRR